MRWLKDMIVRALQWYADSPPRAPKSLRKPTPPRLSRQERDRLWAMRAYYVMKAKGKIK